MKIIIKENIEELSKFENINNFLSFLRQKLKSANYRITNKFLSFLNNSARKFDLPINFVYKEYSRYRGLAQDKYIEIVLDSEYTNFSKIFDTISPIFHEETHLEDRHKKPPEVYDTEDWKLLQSTDERERKPIEYGHIDPEKYYRQTIELNAHPANVAYSLLVGNIEPTENSIRKYYHNNILSKVPQKVAEYFISNVQKNYQIFKRIISNITGLSETEQDFIKYYDYIKKIDNKFEILKITRFSIFYLSDQVKKRLLQIVKQFENDKFKISVTPNFVIVKIIRNRYTLEELNSISLLYSDLIKKVQYEISKLDNSSSDQYISEEESKSRWKEFADYYDKEIKTHTNNATIYTFWTKIGIPGRFFAKYDRNLHNISEVVFDIEFEYKLYRNNSFNLLATNYEPISEKDNQKLVEYLNKEYSDSEYKEDDIGSFWLDLCKIVVNNLSSNWFEDTYKFETKLHDVKFYDKNEDWHKNPPVFLFHNGYISKKLS